MLVIPNEFIDCWSQCHHLQQKPWWQEVESWTSKCCYSKFQMNLIIPFCDILSKAFLYWNFLCGIQTHEQRYLSFLAVLLESWAISILLQSVEHLGLEELEVILWTKGTVKGQTINKKVRNWKAKLKAVGLKAVFSHYSHTLRLQWLLFISFWLKWQQSC